MTTQLVENLTIAFLVVNVISCLASMSVFMTGIFFYNMNMRVFMHVIFFIAFMDFLQSVGGLLGYPAQGTAACALQSILTTVAFRGVIAWTTILCYQLFSVVMRTRSLLSWKYMHSIAWSLTIFFSFIPLSTAELGRQPKSPGETVEWCFIKDNNVDLFIMWIGITWILYAIGHWLVMLYFTFRIWWKYRKVPGGIKSDRSVYVIFSALFLYPLLLSITAGPLIFGDAILFFAYGYVDTGAMNAIGSALVTWSSTRGLFTAMIFFWNSPEARARWTNFLRVNESVRAITSFDLDESSVAEHANVRSSMVYIDEESRISGKMSGLVLLGDMNSTL